MSLYTRARKHIDMDRVKELREEKIKREQIAEILRQQEEIRAELEYIETEESKYVDWRRDLENLNETMTTASMGMINLPAEGNVDIIHTDTTMDNINSSLSQNDSRSGNTITLQGTENQIVDGEHTYFNTARFTVDATRVSHVKITISKGGGTSSWTDRGGENFDDDVTLNISDADDFFAPIFNNTNLTSGTHLISLPGNYKNLRISFEQFGRVGQTGALRITNISLQRRTPLNVFVSLDDPEANAFIRGGLGEDKERRAKLKDMLDAGNELMIKLGLDPSKTSPGDIELASANWPNKNENPPPVYAPWNKGWPSAPGSNRPYEGKPGTPGGSYPMVQSGDIELAASYPKMDPLDKLLKDIDDVDRKFKNKRPGTRPGKGRGMGDTWEGPGKIV